MPITRTLVLGIGNVLLTDEGVGVHVVNYLAERHPQRSDITFLDGGTLSFSLAGDLAEHDQLIVVDAAATGQPPGSLVCHEGDAMNAYLQGDRQSVHEVGLGDLLDICRLEGVFPRFHALVGIQPQNLDWGESLTEPVAATVPRAAECVMALISKWAKIREADAQ